MTEAGFSHTVERLYAAALDADRWPDALQAIEDYTGSAGAVMSFVPTGPSVSAFALAGRFSADQCAEYARDYMAICRRTHFGHTHPNHEYTYDALIMTEAEMDRDPVYAWQEKQGVRYYLATPLSSISGYLANLSLQRTRRQGHIQLDDILRLAELKPHLEQALRLGIAAGKVANHAAPASAWFECASAALLVLDASGHLLQLNTAAETLLSANDGLTVQGGRLVAARAEDTRRLTALIAAALDPKPGAGAWLSLPRPSGRDPLALLATPLPPGSSALPINRPAALLVVRDPKQHQVPDPAVLRLLYGLTSAEARVAGMIAQGMDLPDCAQVAGASIETLRSQLKAVFRKTGVNRQPDLALLVARLAY